jgi:hypothetical protein
MPSKKRGGGKDTESPTAALVSDADASDDDYGTVDDGTTGHPETDRETLLPNNSSLVVEPEAETLGWRTIFVCSFTTLGGFIFGYVKAHRFQSCDEHRMRGAAHLARIVRTISHIAATGESANLIPVELAVWWGVQV